ncbi:hypothetical protein [Curtobacterium sp. MCSS17_016]|uniref:hypothetical protein n=1 Tax=Curtobacterium sp. MCSS17_016 TaxID=2175644 RepID=UPI000DA7C061|nr:hypothetical protein [Curtobacterium sp. MCSS17_016]WIE80940.1 hypothetical protein DEJ19_020705 [Curtobacterium sp. MCSS17_016]
MSDLRVGVTLNGYCGGWFGDSYGEKELVAIVQVDGDAVHLFRTVESDGPSYMALSRDDASQAHSAALAEEQVFAAVDD